MEKSEPQESRQAPSFDLPPPPIGKALLWGGAAALLGALAWALLVVYAHTEYGLLAWGIGVAVGFAVVRAGGHGTPIAMVAGLLALASIASGKQFAFRMLVDRQADQVVDGLTSVVHESYSKQAAEWVALGASPTPQQVQQFAEQHDLEFTSAAEFAREQGESMAAFAQQKPTLDEWRAQVHAEISAECSFADYLEQTFQPVDILFVVLGIASAFGLVRKSTAAMRLAAQQAARGGGDAPAPPAS